MAKLQKTVRGNGSVVFSINIPLEIIEQMDWKKGEILEILKNFDRLIIFRGGEQGNVSEVRDIPGSEQVLEVLPEDSTGAGDSNQLAAEEQTSDSESNQGHEGNDKVYNNDEGANGGEN